MLFNILDTSHCVYWGLKYSWPKLKGTIHVKYTFDFEDNTQKKKAKYLINHFNFDYMLKIQGILNEINFIAKISFICSF